MAVRKKEQQLQEEAVINGPAASGALPEDGTNAKDAELSLEASFDRLDEILAALESEEISLEDSFAMYQKGMHLLKTCNEKIDTVEKKILIMNGDGGFDEF